MSDRTVALAELRGIALFDGLTDAQLEELRAAGQERDFAEGEELFRESRPAEVWWVLLEGTIALVRLVGHEETTLGQMERPGQWAGGFRAWDEHGVYMATGRGMTPGRLLCVPAEALGRLAKTWSPFVVHLITGLVATARRIESTARQREALVALGTLAAGMAHELNNPASAAVRAVDSLQITSDGLLSSLRRLAIHGITAEQFVSLDALRLEGRPHWGVLGPLEASDREDELAEWMEERGVGKAWMLAPSLAGAGFDVSWCERVAGVLGEGPVLDAALEWVAGALSMATLLTEVSESTGRISALVSAIKSYSQLDRASLQQTDLTEGLESTLTVLGHKLSGVTVVRDYEAGLPRIEAVAGELNQVWTNLIDNAVDAMAGLGTLRLATRRVDDAVVVEIGDTGPGMTQEVQAHAFEPFYTTKDVGKGTGLGLDISRRIVVDRHGGEITIESRPGATTIRVSLPLARPSTS